MSLLPGTIIRPEPLRAAVLEGRIRPLSRPLALRMLQVCAMQGIWRIDAIVTAESPASLAELLEATREGGPVPVSGEHGDHTIWGSAALNALFRAWHDTTHVLLSAEFDREGERRVANAQVSHAPRGTEDILWAETFGQVAFHERWGAFPARQREFVLFALRHGLESALAEGERFLW